MSTVRGWDSGPGGCFGPILAYTCPSILIEEALITFCQREIGEIGEIANIFADKAYIEFEDPEYDETELVEKKDPYKDRKSVV